MALLTLTIEEAERIINAFYKEKIDGLNATIRIERIPSISYPTYPHITSIYNPKCPICYKTLGYIGQQHICNEAIRTGTVTASTPV